MLLICQVSCFFLINESIRLRLYVQILSLRRYLKIKRPVMVINFLEILWRSFVVSLRHFAYLQTWLSINLLSALCFSSSLTKLPFNLRKFWYNKCVQYLLYKPEHLCYVTLLLTSITCCNVWRSVLED